MIHDAKSYKDRALWTNELVTLDGSLQGTGGCVHSVRIHRLEQHRYQAGPRYDPSTVQHSMEGEGLTIDRFTSPDS